MQFCPTIASLHTFRGQIPNGKKIGFIPTMGALHEGHGSLIAQSAAQNDITIVSVFVNPTQFGPNEDLAHYPRTLEADIALAERMGADAVFAPTAAEMYPTGRKAAITYHIEGLGDLLCGFSRPGHFHGVVQVVSMLLHIVTPHRAYFGLKDYQQFRILATLILEQHFPVEIVGCNIVREQDGLAMSSRNRYLRSEERPQALFLYDTLTYIKQHLPQFQTVANVKDFVDQQCAKYPLVKLDYFDILNDRTLQVAENLDATSHPRAFMAAFLGKTRLIDNMSLYSHSSV